MKTLVLTFLLMCSVLSASSQFNPKVFWDTHKTADTKYGNDTFGKVLEKYNRSFKEDSLSSIVYKDTIETDQKIPYTKRYNGSEFSLVRGLYMLSILLKSALLDYRNTNLFIIDAEGVSYGVLVKFDTRWTMKAVDPDKVPSFVKNAPLWTIPRGGRLLAHTKVFIAQPMRNE